MGLLKSIIAIRIIDRMNLSAVDLNLLVAFEALYDTRNVTLAGQRINRAQPSVSSALGRLRLLFQDELFLRTADGAFRMPRDKHGIMAGALKKAKYPEYTLTPAPGDAIFVYTDGVPEANNSAGEMYGMGRLEAVLNRETDKAPKELLRAVRRDVDAFVDGARQFDNLTMLCLTCNGPVPPIRAEDP